MIWLLPWISFTNTRKLANGATYSTSNIEQAQIVRKTEQGILSVIREMNFFFQTLLFIMIFNTPSACGGELHCGAGSIELSVKDGDSITTVENEVSQYREVWCQLPRIWKAGDFFICAGKSRSDAQSVAEVWWAHENAGLIAGRIGLLRYLPLWRIHELLNWEAEIYRKKLPAERAL